jgi:hypothetical protein
MLLLRKSLRSSLESLVKPHPSIRGKRVPLLGMLSFFLFEQLFSGVDTLAMTQNLRIDLGIEETAALRSQ